MFALQRIISIFMMREGAIYRWLYRDSSEQLNCEPNETTNSLVQSALSRWTIAEGIYPNRCEFWVRFCVCVFVLIQRRSCLFCLCPSDLDHKYLSDLTVFRSVKICWPVLRLNYVFVKSLSTMWFECPNLDGRMSVDVVINIAISNITVNSSWRLSTFKWCSYIDISISYRFIV